MTSVSSSSAALSTVAVGAVGATVVAVDPGTVVAPPGVPTGSFTARLRVAAADSGRLGLGDRLRRRALGPTAATAARRPRSRWPPRSHHRYVAQSDTGVAVAHLDRLDVVPHDHLVDPGEQQGRAVGFLGRAVLADPPAGAALVAGRDHVDSERDPVEPVAGDRDVVDATTTVRCDEAEATLADGVVEDEHVLGATLGVVGLEVDRRPAGVADGVALEHDLSTGGDRDALAAVWVNVESWTQILRDQPVSWRCPM